MIIKASLAFLISGLILMSLIGCAISQPGGRDHTLTPSPVKESSGIAQLIVWSKGFGNQWIALSGGTFSQSGCVKGNTCQVLRIEAYDSKGNKIEISPTWELNDHSIISLWSSSGSTTISGQTEKWEGKSIEPLKKGQFVITIRANNISKKISGRIFDKGDTFVMTLMEEGE